MNAHVPVLVVGAGPGGTTTALFLRKFGVAALVVEQGGEVIDHPRAHVINTRTMELFDYLGVGAAIRTAGLPSRAMERVVYAQSLRAKPITTLDARDVPCRRDDRLRASASSWASIRQNHVDQVLRAQLTGRDGDLGIALHTRLVELEQHHDVVVAHLEDVRSGARRVVTCDYLVAADGSRSCTRERVGIQMRGPDEIMAITGVYFDLDVEQALTRDLSMITVLVNPDVPGVVISVDGRSRWMLHGPEVPIATGNLADAAEKVVELATDLPPGTATVISTGRWSVSAQVAETLRRGRVFLVGDAGHRFPPSGGYGLNTAVQDAHNLAWKIAFVRRGIAPEFLLDTYDTERRPVAERNAAWSLSNINGGYSFGLGLIEAAQMVRRGGAEAAKAVELINADLLTHRSHFDSLGMDLGFGYEQGALLCDEPPDQATPVEDVAEGYTYFPSARAGYRAPHVPLVRGEATISSAQLWLGQFTLVTSPAGRRWVEAAESVAATGNISLRSIVIGGEGDWSDPSNTWMSLYGIVEDGALLIRPDGHVGWRAPTACADPAAALHRALGACTGRTLEDQQSSAPAAPHR